MSQHLIAGALTHHGRVFGLKQTSRVFLWHVRLAGGNEKSKVGQNRHPHISKNLRKLARKIVRGKKFGRSIRSKPVAFSSYLDNSARSEEALGWLVDASRFSHYYL
jgi:hypothetical protein